MDRLEHLVQWAAHHGATLHKNVEIYDDDVFGIALKATEHIPIQNRIVSCPFSLSLSYLNTLDIFPSLESHIDNNLDGKATFNELLAGQIDPHAIGHFFLVLQYLLGEKSFWWPYIASLPQPDEPEKLGTPLHFDESTKALLADTQVGNAAAAREVQWRTEWSRGQRVLDEATECVAWKGKWNWQLYKWAATIFSSRSFISSLLPQEIFQSSAVSAANELFTCTELRERSAFTLKHGVLPILFPLVDLANHDPTARVTWFSDVQNSPMDLSLLTGSTLIKDQQIFNNYAPKGNSQLLLGYGFMLPGNEDMTLAPKALEGFLKSVQDVWQSTSSTTPAKTTYTLRSKPFLYEEDARLPTLAGLEDGCVDHLALLTANRREISLIRSKIDRQLEIDAERHLRGPLARNMIAVLSTLQEMLRALLDKLRESGCKLQPPCTAAQRMAYEYRRGQVALLETTVEPLMTYLRFCFVSNQTMDTPQARLLPLEIAYTKSPHIATSEALLQREMCKIVRLTLDIAPHDDINWHEVKEDWEYTLWCFWVFCQLVSVESTHTESNSSWLAKLHTDDVYATAELVDDGFLGEESEWECFEELVNGLDWRILGWKRLSDEEQTKLMIGASRIAMEETVVVRDVGEGSIASMERSRLFCFCNEID